MDLHREVAQRLFAEPVRFLVALVLLHRCRLAGGADALDDLDELLRLREEIAPLAAPLREDQQPGLIQCRGGRIPVQDEQLAMDELRLRIAARVEEQLSVLLEHLQPGLGAEFPDELLPRGSGLPRREYAST
ncbi:MAG: hypothetical protein AUH83_05140 [Deltaproteobacteria bacterium 13_1_40CM_4_68_19]|nr:MAG: hypothetical protein AUH83_05140 [Deltaproteobacteria bacterium 13_1_40CM_4_68_19]